MKKLVWLVLLLMLWPCACAELNAELDAAAGGGYTLNVSFLNDTGSDISGIRVYADETVVIESSGIIKSGDTYKGRADISKSKGEAVKVRLEYAAAAEEVVIPYKYDGVKLYIRLPARPFENGETVTAVYVLENNSGYDINNAVIKAHGFESEPITVITGGYTEVSAPVKITFPFSFSAEAGIGRTVIAKSEKVTAEELNENLTVTCVLSGENPAGKRIPVTINIENRGNTAYTSPMLTLNGGYAVSGLPAVIKAGSFVTVNAELPAMNESGEAVFTLSGRAENGKERTFVSDTYRVNITGTAEKLQSRQLRDEKVGETSLVAEALLGISTLRGLSAVAVYTCTGLSAVFLTVIIIKNTHLKKKSNNKRAKKQNSK